MYPVVLIPSPLSATNVSRSSAPPPSHARPPRWGLLHSPVKSTRYIVSIVERHNVSINICRGATLAFLSNIDSPPALFLQQLSRGTPIDGFRTVEQARELSRPGRLQSPPSPARPRSTAASGGQLGRSPTEALVLHAVFSSVVNVSVLIGAASAALTLPVGLSALNAVTALRK